MHNSNSVYVSGHGYVLGPSQAHFSRSPLACNQNIKEDIPTALEVFLCFETKQNETTYPENSYTMRV